MVSIWVLNIIRHVVYIGDTNRDHNFDNHP